MRSLRQVSVYKKVACDRSRLPCESRAFYDDLNYLISSVTGDYTGGTLSSFAALSVNPLELRSGVTKGNGNSKNGHKYIDVVYLLCLLYLLIHRARSCHGDVSTVYIE